MSVIAMHRKPEIGLWDKKSAERARWVQDNQTRAAIHARIDHLSSRARNSEPLCQRDCRKTRRRLQDGPYRAPKKHGVGIWR